MPYDTQRIQRRKHLNIKKNQERNYKKKMKWQPSEQEKTLANHVSDNGLISKIYEELNNLIATQ